MAWLWLIKIWNPKPLVQKNYELIKHKSAISCNKLLHYSPCFHFQSFHGTQWLYLGQRKTRPRETWTSRVVWKIVKVDISGRLTKFQTWQRFLTTFQWGNQWGTPLHHNGNFSVNNTILHFISFLYTIMIFKFLYRKPKSEMTPEELAKREEEEFSTGPLSILTQSVKSNTQVSSWGVDVQWCYL